MTPVPIRLPNLGAGDEPVRVSVWLVEPGESVESGDRVVEALVQGITFDVPAPAAGILTSVERSSGATVTCGEVLGWIEPREADDAKTNGD